MIKLCVVLFLGFNVFVQAEENAVEIKNEPTPTFLTGQLGYGFTSIERSIPGQQGGLGFQFDRNEFAKHGIRADYLNRFDRKETQIQLSEDLKNIKKQALRIEGSWTPGAIIFPGWSLGMTGSSPVYGQPVEMVLGARYSSYSNSHVWMMSPGFDAYAPYGWVFSGRIYFSQIKSPAIIEAKWVAGILARAALYYNDENYVALFYSRNNDTSYEPLLLNYYSVVMDTVGAKIQHWFNDRMGFQADLSWQYRQNTVFSHWITGNVGILFRL